jgi:hypothetical protein
MKGNEGRNMKKGRKLAKEGSKEGKVMKKGR